MPTEPVGELSLVVEAMAGGDGRRGLGKRSAVHTDGPSGFEKLPAEARRQDRLLIPGQEGREATSCCPEGSGSNAFRQVGWSWLPCPPNLSCLQVVAARAEAGLPEDSWTATALLTAARLQGGARALSPGPIPTFHVGTAIPCPPLFLPPTTCSALYTSPVLFAVIGACSPMMRCSRRACTTPCHAGDLDAASRMFWNAWEAGRQHVAMGTAMLNVLSDKGDSAGASRLVVSMREAGIVPDKARPSLATSFSPKYRLAPGFTSPALMGRPPCGCYHGEEREREQAAPLTTRLSASGKTRGGHTPDVPSFRLCRLHGAASDLRPCSGSSDGRCQSRCHAVVMGP